MRKLVLVFALLIASLCSTFGQKVAVKNNLAYDALLTPNLSLEVALGRKITFDTQFGANFFFYTTDPTSSSYKTTKWSHWMVQPELRFWSCDVFNGFFVGLHAHAGKMNVGGIDIPFILNKDGANMKDHRYEGWFAGGGVSFGYHWPISSRFSLEASLGVGYARIGYTKFKCKACGEKDGTGSANYLGPTKATLSLVYLLK